MTPAYLTDMSTATATAAIGTCIWAGHTFRADVKPAATYTRCPLCPTVEGPAQSSVKWTKIRASVTATECGGECRSAKSDRCACSCGGGNHGSAHGLAF